MNKIPMDALNNGWSIGFGTMIPAAKTDLDLLLAEKTAPSEQQAPIVPASAATRPGWFARLAAARRHAPANWPG